MYGLCSDCAKQFYTKTRLLLRYYDCESLIGIRKITYKEF